MELESVCNAEGRRHGRLKNWIPCSLYSSCKPNWSFLNCLYSQPVICITYPTAIDWFGGVFHLVQSALQYWLYQLCVQDQCGYDVISPVSITDIFLGFIHMRHDGLDFATQWLPLLIVQFWEEKKTRRLRLRLGGFIFDLTGTVVHGSASHTFPIYLFENRLKSFTSHSSEWWMFHTRRL